MQYDEVMQSVQFHNCVNPYTDIYPFLVNVGFPIVNYPGFVLSENESFLYAAPAEVFNGIRAVPLADFKLGDLIVTNQRISFIFENGSIQYRIEDIKVCEIVNDEMVVIETCADSYIFLLKKEFTVYVHKLVTSMMS